MDNKPQDLQLKSIYIYSKPGLDIMQEADFPIYAGFLYLLIPVFGTTGWRQWSR